MTTAVYYNGQLASDSRSSSKGGSSIDNRNIKPHKVAGVKFEGLLVQWMVCSGSTTHSNALRKLLDKESGNLNDILAPFKVNIGTISLSALFLLGDGSGLHLYFKKDDHGINVMHLDKIQGNFKAIGTGAKMAEAVLKMFDLKLAKNVVAMAAKLDSKSGGNTVYVSPNSEKISIMTKLSDVAIKRIKIKFNKLLEE